MTHNDHRPPGVHTFKTRVGRYLAETPTGSRLCVQTPVSPSWWGAIWRDRCQTGRSGLLYAPWPQDRDLGRPRCTADRAGRRTPLRRPSSSTNWLTRGRLRNRKRLWGFTDLCWNNPAWIIQLPLVLSSRATAFFSATFHTMRRLSAEAEANRSGLSGHQLIAVMVFLCSDMMDLNLNSLYCWSNCNEDKRTNETALRNLSTSTTLPKKSRILSCRSPPCAPPDYLQDCCCVYISSWRSRSDHLHRCLLQHRADSK